MNKKFTKLMAALALLVFMTPSLVGWGQSSTITIQYDDSFSPALPTASSSANSSATAHTDVTAGDFAFKEAEIYKGSSNNYLMFKENKGYLYNTEDLGTITSVAVTYSSGTSTSGKAGVYFGNSEQSTYTTTSNVTIKGQSKTDTWTNTTNGNGYFQFSTSNKNVQVTKIVITYTPNSGPVTLSAPTLTATPGNGQVSLSWNAISNASSYTVLWADNADFTNGTEIPNATSPQVFENLTNGQTYYFKAKSIGDGTNYLSSDYGSVASATPAIPQLAQPVLTVTYGNTLVTPTWTADANATSYTLEYATSSDFTTGLQNIPNANSGTAITGLTNEVAYYFRLKAIGDGTNYNTSTWSETVTATPSTLVTITITQNQLANFTDSYAWYDWTANNIAGKAYAYKSAGIQVNSSNKADCIYNTTAIPGTIKSIKMTRTSTGTTRTWSVYIATDTIKEANDNNKLGQSQSVDENGTTWTVDDNRDCDHFLLSVSGGSTKIASIEVKYEPKPTYSVAIAESIVGGNVTATPTTLCEGKTVTLTATPADTYRRFDGFTFTKTVDGTDVTSNITVTGPTNGKYTFNMPAYDVTVNATFTQLYDVTVASGIEHGTVLASVSKAAQGEEITLTAEPAQHYEFGSWQVTYGQDGTIEPVNNKFNMPAANVTVSATFTQKVYTITYSVNGNTHQIPAVQVSGGNTIGAFPANPVCGDYSFIGWAKTEGGTNYASTSEIPTGDMTLYAVFGTTSSQELTITPSNSGLTNSYYSGEKTIGSKKFQCTELCTQNPNSNLVIQFKKSSGALYNKTDFGAIYSMVITYYSGTSYKDISVKAGASQNPTSADAIVASIDGDVYTYTFPDNCNYFLLSNGSSGASQVSSIQINYEAPSPVAMTVTRIGDTQTLTENIPATQFVVVQSGGALTFTGTNTNPANLVIEDGGQLYVPAAGKGGNRDGVAATMQKSITAYTSDAEGWNFIASPITSSLTTDDVVGLVTTATYDLYKYNESDHMWHNYKENTDPELPNAAAGFAIAPQTGYLYANSVGTTISFEGTVQTGDALTINDLSYNESAGALAGFNLVGNPFTYAAYANKPYYMTSDYDGETHLVAVDSYWNTAVMPCTGVVVKATSSDKAVTFSKTAPEEPAEANQGSLQLTLAQQATNRGAATTIDNAIVSFNEGSQLEKFYFGTQNANLYIPQNNEEYAIVSTEAQGEMPISFRANENGQYTLTVNAEGVEMNYLHLIDNMTGADIDLLQTPSYTFNAKTTDYESRFRLVFAANNEDGSSTGSEAFAFISDGNIIVNGEGVMQIIDVTGRVIRSTDVARNVSTSGMPAGMYVLRLINGDSVKTQKIVVR